VFFSRRTRKERNPTLFVELWLCGCAVEEKSGAHTDVFRRLVGAMPKTQVIQISRRDLT